MQISLFEARQAFEQAFTVQDLILFLMLMALSFLALEFFA